ncbi:MAG: DoxX family protein [Kofleriaceae bacterium]
MHLAGWIVTGFVVVFCAMDAVMKIVGARPAVEATTKLGFSERSIPPIGFVLLIATALYGVPQTTIIGALSLTAYLGGATAAMVRVGQPWPFPIVTGLMVWAGVLLRMPALFDLIRP